MKNTDTNIKASEDFIREILAKTFKQRVEPEELRNAAKKLCSAIPDREKEKEPA